MKWRALIAGKNKGLITFHKIIRGCEEGRLDSWQLFLSNYTPIVDRWVAVYLPSESGPARRVWQEALQDLTANHFERLRSLNRQAEREFLLDLRALVLDRCAEVLDASASLAGAPQPTLEKVRALLDGLPLTHQQILFLRMAGYSEAIIERMCAISPAVARESLERLQAEYPAVTAGSPDVCPWPAAWCDILRKARALKTDACPPVREFVRMLDGQISWYEKEPMERHMSACLRCLEMWTALRETVYWRREAKECAPREIDELLSGLGLEENAKAHTSLLKRMFG